MACLVLTQQDQSYTLCEWHVLCTLSKLHALREWHVFCTLGKVTILYERQVSYTLSKVQTSFEWQVLYTLSKVNHGPNGKSCVTAACFSDACPSDHVQLQHTSFFSFQEGRISLHKCNLERRQRIFVTAAKDMVQCIIAKCVLLCSSVGVFIVSHACFATPVLRILSDYITLII
jgi:hypothetical protein